MAGDRASGSVRWRQRQRPQLRSVQAYYCGCAATGISEQISNLSDQVSDWTASKQQSRSYGENAGFETAKASIVAGATGSAPPIDSSRSSYGEASHAAVDDTATRYLSAHP